MGDGILFGHEFAGDVAAIAPGADIEGIAVGDRVTGMALGAYAEYCNVAPILSDKPLVLKIPDHVSYEEAATVEPLTVSLMAVKRAQLQACERVLIIGAGMIGLGCVQVIKALHPGCEIIVSDISEKRLAMASAFGADRSINASQEDVVASMKAHTGETSVLYNSKSSSNIDVVIECAGLDFTLNQAMEIVRPVSGRLIAVALYEEQPTVDFNQIVSKNVTVIGTLGYGDDDVKEALQLIVDGKVDRMSLISHRYELARASDAFEAQTDTAGTLKAVIFPNSTQ
jgi:threonine dehydrogenase-like Zn-dependent dehydrogenase